MADGSIEEVSRALIQTDHYVECTKDLTFCCFHGAKQGPYIIKKNANAISQEWGTGLSIILI
jgi:hypothetical protein